MSDSFEAGIVELAVDIEHYLGLQHASKPIAVMIRKRLQRRLLPLLQAAEELLNTMETCHICRGALLLQKHPVRCEDCSSDCENHDGPECPTIQSLHVNLKRLVATWQGK